MPVSFGGVSCAYRDKEGDEQHVLHECAGSFLPGQISAIVGPSGAGKTSLLDILAGRKTLGRITGEVRFEDRDPTEIPDLGRRLSYVQQEDSFIPIMTVHEALAFTVQLRAPHLSTAQQMEKVSQVLFDTGLDSIGGHRIGGYNFSGFLTRGISGGERRRLSLGAGLVSAPSVLLLDEFTTGLDSFNALHMMSILRKEATERMVTVVATIHQPQQRIWDMLDNVFILSCGHMLYAGDPRAACSWFADLGYTPHKDVPGFNECDFILEVISISDWKGKEQMQGNTMKELADLLQAKASFERNRTVDSPASSDKKPYASSDLPIPAGFWVQLRVLTARAIQKYYRDLFSILGRIGCMLLLAALLGLAFMESGNGPFQLLNGLFTLTIVSLILPFVAINIFVSDRQFFVKESKSRMYGALAYYVANTFCEAVVVFFSAVALLAPTYFWMGYRSGAGPFFKAFVALWLNHWNSALAVVLASLALPNVTMAIVAAGGVVMINVIYSNHVVPLSMVSQYVSWLQYLCTARYAFEALVVNQFDSDVVYRNVEVQGMDESASILAACEEAFTSNADLNGLLSVGGLEVSAVGLDINSSDILSNGGFGWSYASNIAGLLVMGVVLNALSYVSLRLFTRELR
eukprot:jgi/Pico_ML_1/52162/g373.t1